MIMFVLKYTYYKLFTSGPGRRGHKGIPKNLVVRREPILLEALRNALRVGLLLTYNITSKLFSYLFMHFNMTFYNIKRFGKYYIF